MIEQLLSWLLQIAQTISIEAFVVIGSFLEEIIAPIPSLFVMTTAALIAKEQSYTILSLGLLVMLSAIAKTISTYFIYVAVDKAEDVVLGKFGKYIGFNHAQVEKIGQILSDTWWDDILLFLARAIPIIPSFPVSVAAGVIKYNVRSYLITTFLGTIVRSIFYLWIGYVGSAQVARVWQSIGEHPVLIGGAIVLFAIIVISLMKLKDFMYEATIHKVSKNTKG